ncbi:MAG TPA: hypothetical protein VNY84_10355 [Acidimicrobiales bacterium]|nr:hypothetical protein [Acidimicrobiales bacterium]
MEIDPLLSPEDADRMVGLWHAFPGYGLYSNEGFATEFAPELAQRYDAAVNFVRTGGRFGRTGESPSMLAARTNYFRETYAYGDDIIAPGIEGFFNHERLRAAAAELHGRPLIVAAIVYANILLPGQELAVHTDVPEFRGANRKLVPQWLLVVMHHSGLFDEWRMPIATGISYFGEGRGGELAYYPQGAAGPVTTYTPRHNTAVVLDTDSVFHGVDRVTGDDGPLERLLPGMRLVHDGDRHWSVRNGDEIVATYRTDDLRYSVSWKAYCFTDEAERRAWATHADDLSLGMILKSLVSELRERGVLASTDHGLSEGELGRVLIDEFIRFPEVVPAGTSAPAVAP